MKPSILIIEDNEQNMYMLSYLLENNNYNIIKAFSGKEGLDLAVKHNPKIILLDIQLPDMDGYEICQKLRTSDLASKTTIIAVTSYAMGGDREKAIKAGADGYIEKPINTETFITEMEKIFNSKLK